MANIGNTFESGSLHYGHARKVWREIRAQYPAGGKVSNLSDWTSAGKIPAGTPCTIDQVNKTVVCHTNSQITTAASANPSTLPNLLINGFTQEDIDVNSNTSAATATVIYDGEIYDYMIDSTVLTALKTLGQIMQVVYVH